jgi:hypothetical protein
MWIKGKIEPATVVSVVKVDTIKNWFPEHSQIRQMSESDKAFKLTLLRIDRDYYLNCDNLCFSTSSNLAVMGDIKGSKHWYREMIRYQQAYQKIADSIEMYHHIVLLDQ